MLERVWRKGKPLTLLVGMQSSTATMENRVSKYSSVAQSCPTLQLHGLQHARPCCPSPTPRVYSKSCPLSQGCIQPSHPLLSPPPTFSIAQHQGLFKWVSSLHQVAKVSASTSVLPNEYSGLISFRMDWLDLLAVQRTLKSFPQHHSLKASILWCSSFFVVQLSHPYMTTGKTVALTRWTFIAIKSNLTAC